MNHYLSGGSFATAKDYPGFSSFRAQYQHIVDGTPFIGPKIEAFQRALQGDWTGVPLDRWMTRAIFAHPIGTANESQVRVGQAIVTDFANRMHWKPSELQAALWVSSFASAGKLSLTTDFNAQLLRQMAKGQESRAVQIARFMQANPKLYKSVGLDLATPDLGKAYLHSAMLLHYFAELHDDPTLLTPFMGKKK